MDMAEAIRKSRREHMVVTSIGGRYFCAWCSSELHVLERAKSWVFIRIVCDMCKRENKVI